MAINIFDKDGEICNSIKSENMTSKQILDKIIEVDSNIN